MKNIDHLHAVKIIIKKPALGLFRIKLNQNNIIKVISPILGRG